MKWFQPIKDCLIFLNNPKREIREPLVENPLLYIHTLFIGVFLINILGMSIISKIIDFDALDSGFDDLQNKFGIWMMAVLAIIVAPTLEELIFRYPLKHKLFLTMLLTFIDMFIIYGVLQWLGFYKLSIIAPFSLAIFSLILLAQSENLQIEWDATVDRLYPMLFLLVATIFAFVHMFNYAAGSFPWYVTPLLVFPQFVIGLVLGFVRLRIGLWGSIYMHALNNSIPMLALILYGNQLG